MAGVKKEKVPIIPMGAFSNPDDAPMVTVTTTQPGVDCNGGVPVGWRGQVPASAFSDAWMETDAAGEKAIASWRGNA